MGSNHRAKLVVTLTSVMLVGIGVAGAQTEAAQPSPAQPAPAVEAAAQPAVAVQPAAAGVAVPPGAAQLTPQQMLERGKSTVERMEAGADNIRRMLREARQERDVVKALCLDDKLTQMDVAKRTAGERLAGLETAVTTNNSERVVHEHAVLDALRERGEGLVAEANQCIGEETGFVGESRVTTAIDPNIPEFDPQVPTDPLFSDPPVLVSPTL